jgi:hypothetical protein
MELETTAGGRHSEASAPPTPALSVVATSKMFFFVAAFLSFLLSVYLWFSGDRERGIFVGLWVPSILSAGGLLLSGARHGR